MHRIQSRYPEHCPPLRRLVAEAARKRLGEEAGRVLDLGLLQELNSQRLSIDQSGHAAEARHAGLLRCRGETWRLLKRKNVIPSNFLTQ